MEQSLFTIVSNSEVMPGTHLMWIEAPDIAGAAQPGQFVTVKCDDLILRRPLAIHQVGSNSVMASPLTHRGTKPSQVALLFRVAGKGTLWLSQRQRDEKLDVLGPFGKGFSIAKQSKHLLLVAGGIGIAPLVYLMQHASPACEVTLIYGAPTSTQLYSQRYLSKSFDYRGIQFVAVTEDGSTGRKGMATHVLPDFLDRADQVYACGPVDMYRAMALSPDLSTSRGDEKGGTEKQSNLKLKRCQISLEVRMGCGFGACFGCTINTRKGLKRVCRDGPVFALGDVIWQEVKL